MGQQARTFRIHPEVTILSAASRVAATLTLLLMGLAAAAGGVSLGCYLLASRGLPSLEKATDYRPPIVSAFYAEDGEVIGRFFVEDRKPVSLDTLPPHVFNAVVAAEDRRFFEHHGVDGTAVFRALMKNINAGYYAQGASTITQQVVRSLLLTNDKRLMRKMREALLAYKLEKRLSKREILAIYMNQVYFGRGRYGIEKAAEGFFDKPARNISIKEAAMLAGLLSNPSKFSQLENSELLDERARMILGRMREDRLISQMAYERAIKEKAVMAPDRSDSLIRAPYFTLAAQRYISRKYGVERLYREGLKVYTTVNLSMQKAARNALLKGAREWETRQEIPTGLVGKWKAARWAAYKKDHNKLHDPGDLVLGYVTKRKKSGTAANRDYVYQVELADGSNYHLALPSQIPYSVGDALRFRIGRRNRFGTTIERYSVPAVEGALVCLENRTGYVRAMVGGLDFDRSRFNRAYQAYRQPGSAFKPLVYAAALEYGGYGPRTVVIDEPIVVRVSPKEPYWMPENADKAYMGAMTLSDALAQSRNVVSAKLALDMGVGPVTNLARAMGIGSSLRPTPSLALGTSEVTLLDLTGAYTAFVNNGWVIDKVLVKRVVDRDGRVLEDNTPGAGSVVELEPGEGPPARRAILADFKRFGVRDIHPEVRMASATRVSAGLGAWTEVRRAPGRVMSSSTAKEMREMLHEVCVDGTASSLASMKRGDIGGKTGTTDRSFDAWFIGFDRKYTTGVWMGRDTNQSLGKGEYGGTTALPVWRYFMAYAESTLEKKDTPGGDRSLLRVSLDRGAVRKDENSGGKKKASLKRTSPVDWYWYRKPPATPKLTTMDWIPLGYAVTDYSGRARILTLNGKTVADGHITPSGKVLGGFEREFKPPTPEPPAPIRR